MLLLGTHVYPAKGDAARRQDAAVAALRALTGVRLVSLQWPDEVTEVEGVRTVARLTRDSLGATGSAGSRKPVVKEVFDLAAEEAVREGCAYFCVTNSDVRVSQALVDRILAEPRDGWAVSRMDTDAETGAELGVTTEGIDTFAVSVDWWNRHRHRFRDYLVGEPVWDNVYTSVLLCHGDAVLLNRGAWTLHERHPTAWRASPFAEYTRLLAALDRPYFTRWAVYHHRLTELRARGASEDEETALHREVFRMAPSLADRAVQAARSAKARLRYALRRGR